MELLFLDSWEMEFCLSSLTDRRVPSVSRSTYALLAHPCALPTLADPPTHLSPLLPIALALSCRLGNLDVCVHQNCSYELDNKEDKANRTCEVLA